ncbi:MAG: hypothetical protein IT303_09665 [Dehalococcoidia bacterium]|nr:hypothetical protein [Dehalococcoidia bacterium]
MPDAPARGRVRAPGIFRGLAVGLTLSFVNLLGAFLTIVALGGLGEWTGTQFVGMFGAIEIATGAAFIIGPNIWRLPVAEAKLSDTPHDVAFAASTILIPHWGGGVKCIAGAAFVAYAAVVEGVGPATLLLPLVVVLVCAASVGISMLFARAGVARPDIDVLEIVVKRPGHRDAALPGLSIGASFVQLLLNVATFPTVKLLPPDVIYRPEIGPSFALLGWMTVTGGGLLALGFAAWWGRVAWRAPRPQQREAEEFAGVS